MAFETIIAEISKRGVATVTLNKPDRGNALSAAMVDELVAHMRALAADEKVRALVLRSSGRHFCGGADVSPNKDGPAPQFNLNDLFETLDRFPKPTICIVQGGAIGAGACFTTCCDVTYAYADAFFSVPEVRLGIVPGGVIAGLMRAMGTRNMRRYALSGERITGPEIVRVGMAHELHAAENMDAALDQLVDAMLLGAPNAQKYTKEQIAEYDHETLRDAEAAAAVRKGPHGIKTPEAQEGVAAFKEKRKPNWYVAP
jgi:methylglutaconyl-CoA hydratase